MSEQSALIIIDMQRGMLPAATPPRNNPGAEDNMVALLAAWRKHKRPIVHVRHMSRSPQGSFWPGSPAAEFHVQLSGALSRIDVNAFAASVQVYALKP